MADILRRDVHYTYIHIILQVLEGELEAAEGEGVDVVEEAHAHDGDCKGDRASDTEKEPRVGITSSERRGEEFLRGVSERRGASWKRSFLRESPANYAEVPRRRFSFLVPR